MGTQRKKGYETRNRDTQRLLKFKEPRLKFAYGQFAEDPRDGLSLFGPFDKGQVSNFSIGIIGTPEGRVRAKKWLIRTKKPIFHPTVDIAKPFFPGFEATFDISFNTDNFVDIDVPHSALEVYYKYSDNHQRVSSLVDLYVDALLVHKREEEQKVDLWFVVIPDEIYRICRPMSRVPKAGGIDTGIKDNYSKYNVGLFENEDEKRRRLAYSYQNNFHNQLKIKLLEHSTLTQIVRESTIAYQDFTDSNGKPKRDLKNFEAAIAWNIATAVYYKMGGLPWKLADARDGVCYIGLVFKNDETQQNPKIACCAAQMFLDSGDGLVFRGAVGPWYNPDRGDYHLDRESAFELLQTALEGFIKRNGRRPKEIFIHGKTYFDDDEWLGFEDAIGNDIDLIGVRIRNENNFKLFRDGDFPVLRNTAMIRGKKSAFLWTKGFIPRLQSVLGLETPNPLSIQVIRGKANIEVVCQDVLALTKLNYNTCMYFDGTPVTLKFANTIGEILTAGPNEGLEVLPFKYYI